MPKTKKVRSKTKQTETTQHIGMSCGCCHHTSLDRCWMCWLFRSLIFLFCAFLLLWVGFCLGILHQNSDYYYPHKGSGMNMERICSRDSMSQRMSFKSIGMMANDNLETLKNLSGTDFDKEFVIQMMLRHEDSLEMARLAIEKSQDQDILDLAQTIIDEQTLQLEDMKEWGSE